MSSISLCMIAKNEAINIDKSISSAGNIVDEIIVVDTGSKDNTVSAALELGAKVIESEWRDDFSYSRNISLENANSEWIIFMDCDEVLTEEGGIKLQQLIKSNSYKTNTSKEAFFVQVINKMKDGSEMTFPSLRLFRNRKEFRFSGKIHEQIISSIIKNYGKKSISYTDITLVHNGYNSSSVNIKRKIKRNLDILKRYTEDEKDGFYFYNLGTEYLRLGQCNKALEFFKKSMELTNPNCTYGPVLVKKTMTIMMESGRYRDAAEQLKYYQQVYPDFSDLFYLEAICYEKRGQFSKAKECLKKYMNMNCNNRWYPYQNKYGGLTAEQYMKEVERLIVKERQRK